MYSALQGSPFRDGFTFATMFEVNHIKRNDPISQIFPTIAECEMADFHGSSGMIAKKYAPCMLSINNVNEKIFVFLWSLFLAMAVCSCLLLIYRFLTIAVPSFRTLLLK
jgi:hypothetical protein